MATESQKVPPNLDVGEYPLLKRIREKGLRRGLFESIDEAIERTTVGLNLADLRALLQDRALSKPNVRLKPHADAFWTHIRPTYFHTDAVGFYPTLRLGWLSTYLFVLEIITGIFLMVFYTPSNVRAFPNMLNLLSNVPFGQFVRDLHRFGAEAMVAIVSLHMLRTFLTGSYKKPRQYTWATGFLLFVVTLGLSYTGYLLPWDQLALWAVTIGASMLEAAPPPVVGNFVNVLVKGAPDLGAAGLLRFYLLHVFLFPTVLLALLGIHYYKVVVHGHSLPPEKEEPGVDTAARIPREKRRYFLIDQLRTEMLWVVFVTLVMVAIVVWFYDAPLEPHANPLSTPLHTVAPWYFLWIQGLLKLGDKTLMGVILPTILIGAFTLWPYFDVGPNRRYGARRPAITLSLLFVSAIFILTWMGTPDFAVETSPDQEIMFEMAPSTKVGLVRAIPYEDLVPGAYSTEDYESTVPGDAPELLAVMEEYAHLVEEAQEELPNAVGFMVIDQMQADLRGVTLRLVWDDPTQSSGQNSNVQLVPVHADAGYKKE